MWGCPLDRWRTHFEFSPEHRAYQEATGACGCCGLSIFAGTNGTVYILYRSARETVDRGNVYLLASIGWRQYVPS